MNAPDKKYQLLIFVLLVALFVRLQSVKFGLPFALNPDEPNYLSKILYLTKYFLNPGTADIPGFFLYFHSLIIFLTSGTIDRNIILNTLDFSPGSIYAPLRTVSVFFSVGSVVLVFLIGNYFSSLSGLLAATLLAVSLGSVMFSHLFSPFSAVVFFLLLSTLFALKAYRNNNLDYLKSSAIFSSLSFSMHYIGIVAVAPVLFVMALKKDFSKLKSFLSLFLIIFFILNPYSVFYLFIAVFHLLKNYFVSYEFHHSGSYLTYLFSFLIPFIGPVAWISSVFLLKYKKDYDEALLKILFSLPLMCFAILGLFHLTNAGYATALVPYFCLGSGLVISSIYNKASELKSANASVKWFLLIVLFLMTFYIPLKYTLKYNKLVNLSDTRALATEWIKENSSMNYKIAWDKNSVQINFFDPYNIQDLKAVSDDKELLRNRQKFPVTAHLLKDKNWLKYLKKKVDYVVINSLDYEKALRQDSKSPEKKYYAQILKLKPAITFNPYLLEQEKNVRSFLLEDLYMPLDSLWYRERTGPIIKIYKL